MGKTKGYKQEYQVRWNNARLKINVKKIFTIIIFTVLLAPLDYE